MTTLLASFSAQTIPGAGRGKINGIPTINLDTEGLPSMQEGIYACFAMINGKKEKAVMHYGPRPVYDDPAVTCEIHLLDQLVKEAPGEVSVIVVDFIREVRDFPTVDAMRYEIERDIETARGMLGAA